MRHFIIPGRAGSKGIPYKNPMLMPFIWQGRIPRQKGDKVIVSTDDPLFHTIFFGNMEINLHKRSARTAADEASMKDVLLEVVQDCSIPPGDDLVVLYPAYISRTAEDVRLVWGYYQAVKAPSVLCCYKPDVHPYFCFFPGENNRRVEDNTHYRRQDLPEVYAYSHYVVCLKVSALPELDRQLTCPGTRYYLLDKRPRDVNTLLDIEG